MVDETVSLRLPKPLLDNEIRRDFLNFSPDRRWDLLGFIKSDEVEEIKSSDVGPDGHRYYLVRWKDSWKPESSLVYCEKLLQDFWSKRSILHENNVIGQTLAPCDITNGSTQHDIIENLVPPEITTTSYITHILATPDISQSMATSDKLNIIDCSREHSIESTMNFESLTSEDIIPVSNATIPVSEATIPVSETTIPVSEATIPVIETTIPVGDVILDNANCSNMGHESTDITPEESIFSSECVAENGAGFVVVIDSSESPHVQTCDQTYNISDISAETLENIPAEQHIMEIVDVVENHNTFTVLKNRDTVIEAMSNTESRKQNVFIRSQAILHL